MVITEKIKVRIVPSNIRHYKKLGYNVKPREEIEVYVKDLPLTSKNIVKVECDNCHEIKELRFGDYMIVFNKKNKYYCSNCKAESIKEGVKKKYGEDIENVFQLNSVKKKIVKTCQKKYGVDHHLQNNNILEKQKKTNQERYGVDFIPELKKNTQDIFIKRCNDIHNNLYDYSLVNYIRVDDKIKIICKKHGEFEQRGYSHLGGEGCPKCKTSKGENIIIEYLNENNITYQYQKKFDDCVYKTSLPFDFYFPDLNMCLEYDGIQHFISIDGWGGEEEFKLRKKKDKIKNNYCKNKGIKLVRIKYDEDILEKLQNVIYKM